MPIQPFQPHYPFTDEKLAQLRQIVPEAFEDGRLNFETLREVLEPRLDPEGQVKDDDERFGLLWPGKKEARRLAAIPSKGTLAPVYGQGLKADGTPDTDGQNDSRNVFIEGENLEVLKIMQKAYAGRIKMIYIDPPYNTGNDFVYDDNFTEPLEHYLRRTGQIDDEGQKLTTNTKADGRFHSKWLSMMYPRLRLARNLLREDGVIFVSIDDNEVHNLRQLMNEVFGEENFVGKITWRKKRKGSYLAKDFVSITEYCLVFRKQESEGFYVFGGRPDEDESQPLVKKTNPVSELFFGPYVVSTKLADGVYEQGTYGNGDSATVLLKPVEVRGGKFTSEIKISGRFIWSQEYLDNELLKGGEAIINTKNFLPRVFKVQGDRARKGILSYVDGVDIKGANEDAYADLTEIFKTEKVFDYSKPTEYLKYFIKAGMMFDKQDIILDFYAGSGSTAQAVLELKKEGFDLRYILVQAPFKIDLEGDIGAAKKLGFNNISDITKHRLKHVSHKIGESGFKSYQYRKKELEISFDVKSLQEQFNEAEKKYNPQTLLWEVALNEGFPLDSRVETRRVGEQTVHTLRSEFHGFALHCCFDSTIAPAAAPQITLGENDVFVCLDSALDDQTKLRLSDKGLLKTI